VRLNISVKILRTGDKYSEDPHLGKRIFKNYSLTRIMGLNPSPLGRWFLGWGFKPHPKNPIINY
jgi:hypothetical protein